ncbi:unnamed protein product [Anisakis simplex]|uniref:WSD domain-containing protein n=1 Tax=Anisakis simplex TaxID=6269 RepID=A0A0M3J1K4_ANISI|nr:unnamed protein product [Anisakis simplex]
MLNGIENSDSDQLKSGALFSWSARLILCLKRRGSEMDDDNYNTIDPRDLFGDDDDDQLMYGDDQMQSDEPVGVISELNALDQRRPKRPINVDDCDALDWHMRVPCSFEELYECHRKEQENEEILNRITSRILQARKRRRMNANLEANQEDDENEKENHQNRVDVMLYPPTDGSPWIGVSAPDYGQRYYLRLRNVSSSSLLRHRTSDRHSSTASTSKHSNPTQLNSRPIDAILESARLELQSRLEAKQACDRMEFEPYPMETILSSPNCADSELWVDKYAPKTYVDLISDEVGCWHFTQIHRE